MDPGCPDVCAHFPDDITGCPEVGTLFDCTEVDTGCPDDCVTLLDDIDKACPEIEECCAGRPEEEDTSCPAGRLEEDVTIEPAGRFE